MSAWERGLRLAWPLLAAACGGDAGAPDPDEVLGKQGFESTICGQTLQAGAAITTDFEVDCTGLNAFPGSDLSFGVSRLRVYDPATGATSLEVAAARCVLITQGRVEAPKTPLGLAHIDRGLHSLVLYELGNNWAVQDGCLSLTEEDGGAFGRGQYDAVLFEKDGATNRPTGRWARANGPIDWCTYGRRADCPIQPDATLDKVTTIDVSLPPNANGAPVPVLRGQGRASDCRIAFDSATKGVRVELALAFWEQMPITDIATECGTGGVRHLPVRNYFWFQDGGVDGPGTYTRSSRTYPGDVRMPDFELSTPIGFEWLQNLLRVCSTGEFQEVRSTKASDLSDCTYTLSTSPGRFELSCSASDSTTRLGGTVNPSFQLASDCDVVMR